MIYYAQDLVNRPPLSSSEVNWFAPKVSLSSFIWMISVIRYIRLHLLYCEMILRTAEKHSLDTILGHYPVLLSGITLHSNNQHQQSPAIICKQVLNSSDENSENILYSNRN